ncbi:DUF4176 domain-containing protein [Glaesserella sp.]|uniref:DUF4176 domain-containing protein n=1 Tax=Glaesserella sp. TaxID=2094731 RepID=UPI00359FD9A5
MTDHTIPSLLPIGSIIQLHGADEGYKMMIINRVIPVNYKGEEGYFEYLGCPHVIGATGDNRFYFNTEDIKKVYFKGYIDNDEVEAQLRYQEFLRLKPFKKLYLEDSE